MERLIKFVNVRRVNMEWYSMRRVASELGMAVNTFKRHYLDKYPPDRETVKYKGYTLESLNRMKAEIGAK